MHVHLLSNTPQLKLQLQRATVLSLTALSLGMTVTGACPGTTSLLRYTSTLSAEGAVNGSSRAKDSSQVSAAVCCSSEHHQNVCGKLAVVLDVVRCALGRHAHIPCSQRGHSQCACDSILLLSDARASL